MDNHNFWSSVHKIIADGFTGKGNEILERYGELLCNGRLIFKRFSPQEQHGCAAGGPIHVIASILAGAEAPADCIPENLTGFKRELKLAAFQAKTIECWAKSVGVWIDDVEQYLTSRFGDEIAQGGEAKVYDGGVSMIKSIGLDYFLFPVHALDRISLHNTFFPETNMTVIGFGRNRNDEFQIIVEQPFIEGSQLTDAEIEEFASNMGFTLKNRRNWTYTNPYIYLSDLHDENVIKSASGTIYVIDCDIRLNTPDLKLDGVRNFSNEIEVL